MTSILIIPGLGGSAEHHWQTHWEQSMPNARVARWLRIWLRDAPICQSKQR
jgi:predicted alpha/beta hydrolase family esterase